MLRESDHVKEKSKEKGGKLNVEEDCLIRVVSVSRSHVCESPLLEP